MEALAFRVSGFNVEVSCFVQAVDPVDCAVHGERGDCSQGLRNL